MSKFECFQSIYQLKFNVSYGRTLYANKKYDAAMGWTDEGYYAIIDYDDNMKALISRTWDNDKKIDHLMNLNCWDIMFLLENKEGYSRDDLLESINVFDLEEEE